MKIDDKNTVPDEKTKHNNIKTSMDNMSFREINGSEKNFSNKKVMKKKRKIDQEEESNNNTEVRLNNTNEEEINADEQYHLHKNTKASKRKRHKDQEEEANNTTKVPFNNMNYDKINDSEQNYSDKHNKAVKRKRQKEQEEGPNSMTEVPINKCIKKRPKLVDDHENIANENEELGDQGKNDMNSDNQGVEYWKKFLKSLKEDKALDTVQYLLLDIKGRDIIAEYLEAGGNALRIVEVLNKEEKKTTSVACTIFAAVRLIILKCMSKFPLLEVSTEQTCKHILNSYGTMLHDIVTTSTTFREKKVVLSLLAAMATMNLSLANEVLAIFNTLTVKDMDRLAARSTFGEEKSVRVYFLHLFLAFFSHGRSHLIKMLLGLKTTIRSVSRGLMHDDATTVCLVLTALQDNIVGSDTIIKTLKIHTFNTFVLLDIVSLYNWQGPKSKKAFRKKKTIAEDDENVSSKAFKKNQQLVRKSVHKFLLQLLTNHKLGVIFRDPSFGTSGKRCNELAYSVLKIVEKEKYWKCDLLRQLTVKVLEACPDLVFPVLNLLLPAFEPIPSGIFLKSVRFLHEIINNVSEEMCLSSTLNIKLLSQAVSSMIFSTPVSSVLATEDCLNHPHPIIRLQGISTLLCCFNKVLRLISVVKQCTESPQDTDSFKHHVVNYINKNIKSMPLIVKAIETGLEGEIFVLQAPAEEDYYMTIIDLLLVYFELCPKTLQNEPKLVTSLANFKSVESELLSIKLTKLTFLLNPSQSTITEFGEMVETLVHLLGKQPMAKNVLKDIMESSNVFMGNKWEVDIWLHCFEAEVGNTVVIKLFIDSLNKMVEKAGDITQILSVVKELAIEESPKTRSVGELDWEDFIKISKNEEMERIQIMKPLTYFSVSLLVPAVVLALGENEYSSKDIKEFVVSQFIHVLHAQASPVAFFNLIQDCQAKVMKNVKKYTSEWMKVLTDESFFSKIPHKLLNVFHLDSAEYKICEALYEPKSDTMDCFTQITNDFDAGRILLLLRMVIFHVSQLAVKGSATADIVERATTLTKNLLFSLISRCDSYIAYIQDIILYPILIEKFKPLDSGYANNLTQIVLTVIKSCNLRDNEEFTAPYKQRAIELIKHALFRNKKAINFSLDSKEGHNLFEALEVLSIPAEEAQLILKSILGMNNDRLKLWLDVAEYMLITVSKHSLCLSADVVKQLPLHRHLHEAAALYFDTFPHQMSLIKTDVIMTGQEELSKLTELILTCDGGGHLLKNLLNNNKQNSKVLFPALAAASVHPSFKTATYQVIHDHVSNIQEALKSVPPPTWLSSHSAFIGSLIKEQMSVQSLSELRDFFIQEWNNLEVTETLLDIAMPVFAKMKQQATLVKMLLLPLRLSTTPDTFDRCEKLCHHIQKYVESYQQNDWSSISKENDWDEWCKLALKYGEDPEIKAPFLLSTLYTLCSSENCNLDNLLEMVFSHSQFLNALIWKTQTKYELLQLILKLVTLKPSMCHSNHVPIYLSAYAASLSNTDQIILQLLQLYEQNGVGLSNWKPYFWGETAIGFYSLRNKATPSLLHTAKSKEVFNLFNRKMVESTITRFPIDRNLKVDTIVESDKEVYDPAFFLPLLADLLASNEVVKIKNVIESGALALTICALSSQHKLVRSAAYLVIARFHQHLLGENSDSLCLQFVEALYKGVCSLNQDIPKLPTITTTFLARTHIVLTESSHPMYKALGRFIIVKPELNFTYIPEWSRLFWSTEFEHKIHREWILEVMRDSIRQGKDIGLIISNGIIPILMDYFSSVLSDKKTKLLTLEVIQSVFKASEKNRSLCHTVVAENGMLSWLSHIIYSPNLNPMLLSTLIILLSTIKSYVRSPIFVLNLVLHLLNKCPTKEQIKDLLTIVDSLPTSMLSINVVNSLIQASSNNNCKKQCCDILKFGIRYQKKIDENDQEMKHLKNIVIKYVKNVEKQKSLKLVKNKTLKVKHKSKNLQRVTKNNKNKASKLKKPV